MPARSGPQLSLPHECLAPLGESAHGSAMRTRPWQVCLLLFEEMELEDVAGLLWVLSEAGRNWNWRPFQVTTVASQPGLVSTRSQLSVQASRSFAEVSSAEILLVPGGFGARLAARSADTVAWVQAVSKTAEHWATLGYGSGLLAAAGLLDGKRVAGSPELLAAFSEFGSKAQFTEEPAVVEDAPLLSAARSALAHELGLALVRRILGAKQEHTLRTHLGLPPPPLRIAMPTVVRLP
jgi:transcriptional regulator GlxA family with amidase domain